MTQSNTARRNSPGNQVQATPPNGFFVSVTSSAINPESPAQPHAATPAMPYPMQTPPANLPVPLAPVSQRPATATAVDLREAAEMLNVSAQTMRREINRGLIKALRIGRVWRIRVSEIEAYLERMENRGKRTLRF